MSTKKDLKALARAYEQRLERPFDPLTDLQHSTLRRLWGSYRDKRGEPPEPPWVVAKEFTDKADKQVIAAVVAIHPVAGEPWLVRGVLRTSDQAPTLVRIAVEHFEDASVEPTSAVLHRIPVAKIRDLALAWLAPQETIADALEVGWTIKPAHKRWARRVSAEARKKPLTRGRKGYPPEHYRRIALRAVELFSEGHRDVVKRLTEEESKPYQTVRDWIARARAPELGFLEPATKQGRSDFRPGPNLYPKED
jgi:hypothetical protein